MELNKVNNPNEIDDTTLKETFKSVVKLNLESLNLIAPPIGTIINELLFELPGRIKQERINKLVFEIEERLKRIENLPNNIECQNKEDLYDLTVKVFESATKANTDFKRKFLANIYINTFLSPKLEIELNLIFCDYINSFTEYHISILKFIQNNKSGLIEIGSYPNFYNFFKENQNFELDKYEFKLYCSELEAKSLISTGGGLENFDDMSVVQHFSDHEDASVFVTSLGQKFINYLVQ